MINEYTYVKKWKIDSFDTGNLFKAFNFFRLENVTPILRRDKA